MKIFHRLDAGPWADRASGELVASGVVLAAVSSPGLRSLTPQELQVAIAIADGAATKAVAAQLFLSPKTIEYHLGNIYRKLDVASRSELRVRVGATSVDL